MSRARVSPIAAALLVTAWLTAVAGAASSQEPQASQIPAGPPVRVSDGWYHLDTCSIAVGRQAPSMALADALRRSNGACPICEPLQHEPDWKAFVAAHGAAIKEEVRAKAEAEAAEAKRRVEEAEAARLKRLAELESDRKRRENAPVVRLTEAQARAAAQAALAEAKADPAQFQSRYRAHVRELSPDYAGPQIVYASGVLKILAAGPVAKFEAAVMERLQKGLAPAGAVWSPDVSILVRPDTADAPDIKQIVVQRSDTTRPAGEETVATVLSNTLVSRRLPGAAPGAKFITSGDVVFPLATFEPGEAVVVRVIAVPAAGANLSRTFSGFALRAIQ